jgi:hypothetical protein
MEEISASIKVDVVSSGSSTTKRVTVSDVLYRKQVASDYREGCRLFAPKRWRRDLLDRSRIPTTEMQPVVIIGGTRGTGFLIAQALRQRRTEVRVLARDPGRSSCLISFRAGACLSLDIPVHHYSAPVTYASWLTAGVRFGILTPC